jgi:ubiquinone/menaquinone biosynthesis C-methylase UbiE
MNAVHNLICSSRWWDRRVQNDLIPWGLEGVELGDEVLEIGPGFGATTRLLARRPIKLTVLELDPGYCERLRSMLGDDVAVVRGDATNLPFEDARFSAAVCFTMLHHIPTAELQDQAFNEVARVLQPGGTFAGTDSVGTGPLFKLIHVGDTLNLLDPGRLPHRFADAGLTDATVERGGRSIRFRARKPAG